MRYVRRNGRGWTRIFASINTGDLMSERIKYERKLERRSMQKTVNCSCFSLYKFLHIQRDLFINHTGNEETDNKQQNYIDDRDS